jgi:hypothetical protein
VGELPSGRTTDELIFTTTESSFATAESGSTVVDSRLAATGSSYEAEAAELESVKRPKKTATELEEMANADHGPQRHHPQRAGAQSRFARPGAEAVVNRAGARLRPLPPMVEDPVEERDLLSPTLAASSPWRSRYDASSPSSLRGIPVVADSASLSSQLVVLPATPFHAGTGSVSSAPGHRSIRARMSCHGAPPSELRSATPASSTSWAGREGTMG